MKLTLFLCILLLSFHGWCASVSPARSTGPFQGTAPSRSTARIFTSGHKTVENVDMGVVMIGFGLLVYFAVIFWWAIAAKKSLDRILRGVVEEMGGYAV